MKKLLLLFVITISFSCSDDDSSSTSNNYYNPPAWIQGTWGMENEILGTQAYFKFTSEDICQLLNSGISQLCWQDTAQHYNQSGVNVDASDTSTGTTYEARLGAGGATNILKFQKVSATKIIWLNGSIDAELIKLD